MVDPRAKGSRGETTVRDALRKATGLQWERTPGSGALDAKHNLKGDLYVPNKDNAYCVEVKNYADDHLTSKVLSGKNPQLFDWWDQTLSQSIKVNKKPLLIFKHDRSKLFTAFKDFPMGEDYVYMYIHCHHIHPFYIALLDDWLKYEKPEFVR